MIISIKEKYLWYTCKRKVTTFFYTIYLDLSSKFNFICVHCASTVWAFQSMEKIILRKLQYMHESSCSPFLQQFYENNSFLGMEKYWYNLECYGFPMLHYISSDILQLPYVHPSANIKWLEQSYHQFYLIY